MSNIYRGIKNSRELDVAILKSSAVIDKRKARLTNSYITVREHFTFSNLLSEAGNAIVSRFRRK